MEGHVTLANKRIPYKSIPVNKPIEMHLQSINTDAREAQNRVPILFHKEINRNLRRITTETIADGFKEDLLRLHELRPRVRASAQEQVRQPHLYLSTHFSLLIYSVCLQSEARGSRHVPQQEAREAPGGAFGAQHVPQEMLSRYRRWIRCGYNRRTGK